MSQVNPGVLLLVTIDTNAAISFIQDVSDISNSILSYVNKTVLEPLTTALTLNPYFYSLLAPGSISVIDYYI